MQRGFFFVFLLVVGLSQAREISIIETSVEAKVTCDVCEIGVALLRAAWEANATQDDIVKLAINFCIDFKIEDTAVCSGIVPAFSDMFVAVLAYEVFTPAETCGLIGLCPFVNNTHHSWNVTFPKPKPPHVPPTPPQPNAPRFYAVHLSDIHYDPEYVEGMNNECGEPLCCRAFDGPGKTNETRAGYWGDYNCDLNYPMFQSLLQQLPQLSPQPTYVFWTGDNPPHDVWMQSKEKQINSSAHIAEALYKTFGNITVFPAVGNHEGFPVDSFPLPPASAWLYDSLAEQWAYWIKDETALQTLRYGGYYTVEAEAGLRIVSLNMNYCNNINAWLWMNETDPGHMLEWFVGVMQSAEDLKEKVYILGHIPPGVVDCVEPWASSFYEIINRYEDTIVAQFYGHVHTDQLEIFYDFSSVPPRATNVGFLAPSGTTFTGLNPGFRVYEFDVQSKYLVDSLTYYTDLDQANLNGQPKWQLEYSAADSYNMTDLFPESWDAVVAQFESDQNFFQQTYFQYLTKSSPASDGPCTGNCFKQQICNIKSGHSGLYRQCMGEALYKGGLLKKNC